MAFTPSMSGLYLYSILVFRARLICETQAVAKSFIYSDKSARHSQLCKRTANSDRAYADRSSRPVSGIRTHSGRLFNSYVIS